jgi:hypothetical protein
MSGLGETEDDYLGNLTWNSFGVSVVKLIPTRA